MAKRIGFLRRKAQKAMIRKQYNRRGERILKKIRSKGKETIKNAELIDVPSRFNVLIDNESDTSDTNDLPSWLNDPLDDKMIIPPKILLYYQEEPLEKEVVKETEDWEEVPVPSRRGMVEAIPPEDEPLNEEEERLKVLLENFHLSPEGEARYNWLRGKMLKEHQRRHADDDCLITRVVRQSKITEFFKPKKNN